MQTFNQGLGHCPGDAGLMKGLAELAPPKEEKKEEADADSAAAAAAGQEGGAAAAGDEKPAAEGKKVEETKPAKPKLPEMAEDDVRLGVCVHA
jgi:hypothetical protein